VDFLVFTVALCLDLNVLVFTAAERSRLVGLAVFGRFRHDCAGSCFLCESAFTRIAIRLQTKKSGLPQVMV